ncbi:HAD family phosphatase [Streptomyces sp. NPDC047718]|uniref:HAD family hydrolase n=1 Tax=Streptomyces sp. NPDC047718 TaxID=3155479 RepID=UPI0033DA935C
MGNRKVQAVLFDMFGVIARLQSPGSRAVLERTAGADPERFWEAYWSRRPPYDRGEVAGPAYWAGVCAQLGIPLDDRLVGELIAADLASWSEVDRRSVDLLGALAGRGVVLGLLSNIPEELAARYEAAQPWLDRFTVVGLSCRIGSAKPEPDAYTWCVRALGLAAEEILFVDDNVGNVRAARELGLRGHVFTSHEALAAELEAALEIRLG